jgi:hypothetical protein
MIKGHKELLELEVQEKTKELQEALIEDKILLKPGKLDEILEIQKRFHDV